MNKLTNSSLLSATLYLANAWFNSHETYLEPTSWNFRISNSLLKFVDVILIYSMNSTNHKSLDKLYLIYLSLIWLKLITRFYQV